MADESLQHLADVLRPRVNTWYHEELAALQRTRDELVNLAAKAHVLALTGDLQATCSVVNQMNDVEFRAAGDCTITSDFCDAYADRFPIEDAVPHG